MNHSIKRSRNCAITSIDCFLQAAIGQPRVQTWPAGGAGAATGKEQELGYLHPLGRLSLAVDFPTEGHVYHFQKVKANAVLDIKFSDPKIMQRWIRIGIFAAIAVVLWLLGRLRPRSRRRQEAG